MSTAVLTATLVGLLIGVLIGILAATWRGRRKRESLHLELAVVRAQVKTDEQIDRERQAALDQTIERLRSSFDNVAGASMRSNNEVRTSRNTRSRGRARRPGSMRCSPTACRREVGRSCLTPLIGKRGGIAGDFTVTQARRRRVHGVRFGHGRALPSALLQGGAAAGRHDVPLAHRSHVRLQCRRARSRANCCSA